MKCGEGALVLSGFGAGGVLTKLMAVEVFYICSSGIVHAPLRRLDC